MEKKPENVKIIQINSAGVPSGNSGYSQVFGLGDDGNVYIWNDYITKERNFGWYIYSNDIFIRNTK